MGFNEIQFDYVRFPDGTWGYDEAGTIIDYRNTNDESRAQAVQRFCSMPPTELHEAGVYVSADVGTASAPGKIRHRPKLAGRELEKLPLCWILDSEQAH